MDNDGVHAFLFTTKKEKREHAPALLRECAVLFRPLVVLLERGGRVRGKWERWWEREREREREREYFSSVWDKSINQSEEEKRGERKNSFFPETLNGNREYVSFPF